MTSEQTQAPAGEQVIVLAFFDVLGFSAKVREIGLVKIREHYEALIELVSDKAEGRVVSALVPAGDGGLARIGGYRHLEYAYFSDTIMLWCKYEQPLMESFILSVADFFCAALAKGLALRGCITFGSAIMDRQRGVFLGEPIIEAARGESAQSWVGASFGPSLQSQAGRFGWLGDLRHVRPFSGHTKAGKADLVDQFVLDWPRRWTDSFQASNGSPIAAIDALDTATEFRSYYAPARALIEKLDSDPAWWKSFDRRDCAIAGHWYYYAVSDSEEA